MVGWCDGAGQTSSAGVSYNLDHSRARACCGCSGCGWGWFAYFFSRLSFLSSFSRSLWEMVRYRLKYCLKGPLRQKQPTNLFSIVNYTETKLNHNGHAAVIRVIILLETIYTWTYQYVKMRNENRSTALERSQIDYRRLDFVFTGPKPRSLLPQRFFPTKQLQPTQQTKEKHLTSISYFILLLLLLHIITKCNREQSGQQ